MGIHQGDENSWEKLKLIVQEKGTAASQALGDNMLPIKFGKAKTVLKSHHCSIVQPTFWLSRSNCPLVSLDRPPSNSSSRTRRWYSPHCLLHRFLSCTHILLALRLSEWTVTRQCMRASMLRLVLMVKKQCQTNNYKQIIKRKGAMQVYHTTEVICCQHIVVTETSRMCSVSFFCHHTSASSQRPATAFLPEKTTVFLLYYTALV